MVIKDVETGKEIGWHKAVNDWLVYEPYKSQQREFFYIEGDEYIKSRVIA